MTTAIVTTTIFVPGLLKEYAENAKKYNHRNLFFVVIGDKKTPVEVKQFCKKLEKDEGYRVAYFDVEEQIREFESSYKELLEYLPYNSIQRRNLGILYAYQQGAEKIITIDDDNKVTDEDFVGGHEKVAKEAEWTVVSSNSGWFNVCSALQERDNQIFFHRGFPVSRRTEKPKIVKYVARVRTIVNAGFWLEDPDVDAICRLNRPVDVTNILPECKEGFVLAKGTWSPFNSQNTCLAREVVPAYFLSPCIGRYDDIWASYVVKAIADHLGHAVAYGKPLVKQVRNPHNYFKDYELEKEGMMLTDFLCKTLMSIQLKKETYAECYDEIIEGLQGALKKESSLGKLEVDKMLFFERMIEGMSIWSRALKK